MPADTQFAWVIERYNHDSLLYWTGRKEIHPWSGNPDNALRFARKADASAMLTWHCDGIGRAVEHGWIGKVQAATEDAPIEDMGLV